MLQTMASAHELWHSKVDKIVKILNINIKYVNPKKVYENVQYQLCH